MEGTPTEEGGGLATKVLFRPRFTEAEAASPKVSWSFPRLIGGDNSSLKEVAKEKVKESSDCPTLGDGGCGSLPPEEIPTTFPHTAVTSHGHQGGP